MIFNFLTSKSATYRWKIISDKNNRNKSDTHIYAHTHASLFSSSTLLGATFAGALLLAGCQPSSESTVPESESETSTQTDVEDTKPAPQSDSARALIEQFQPLYVSQVQGLQRRLQAEYEALQAADSPDSENTLLSNSASAPANNESEGNDTAALTATQPVEETVNTESATTANAPTNYNETDINISTEIGERDLEVLKRISLEPRQSKVLTEAQIIERYQQAMQALYQPAVTPLSAQDSDTLINIMTLLPQLFEHEEIANRVNIKSPALARLIIQHQVWQQIEEQQALDMQQMKRTQQQEFETLMTKFNETIKGYDEQIAKYEQTLKEFQ